MLSELFEVLTFTDPASIVLSEGRVFVGICELTSKINTRTDININIRNLKIMIIKSYS